ncbi:MAG: hypothetical protein ABIA74_02845 [bacterium]
MKKKFCSYLLLLLLIFGYSYNHAVINEKILSLRSDNDLDLLSKLNNKIEKVEFLGEINQQAALKRLASNIKQFPFLKELTFYGHDESLFPTKLKNLEAITFFYNSFKQSSIPVMQECKELAIIGGSGIREEDNVTDLSWIANKFPNLTTLSISQFKKLDNIDFIKKLKLLDNLTLNILPELSINVVKGTKITKLIACDLKDYAGESATKEIQGLELKRLLGESQISDELTDKLINLEKSVENLEQTVANIEKYLKNINTFFQKIPVLERRVTALEQK